MKQKTNLSPYDFAFNKLYFVNLFAAKNDVVCNDFMAAKLHYPKMAAIAEKLTGDELKYLIDKIEAII